MTKKEIKTQIALGTLPFREWMKLKGIILKNKWWYFPVPKGARCYLQSKMITIDDVKYYPIHDDYINDLQYSMAWNKWTEEEFAKEIIVQCYACMGLETIDH